MCDKCDADGSWEEFYDGHGIYMGRGCEVCAAGLLRQFRPDIFAHYDCDEPIDAD